MSSKYAKLDLNALIAASKEARERLSKLPKWQQNAVKYVSGLASSEESREVLDNEMFTKNKPMKTTQTTGHYELFCHHPLCYESIQFFTDKELALKAFDLLTNDLLSKLKTLNISNLIHLTNKGEDVAIIDGKLCNIEAPDHEETLYLKFNVDFLDNTSKTHYRGFISLYEWVRTVEIIHSLDDVKISYNQEFIKHFSE